MDLLFIYFFLDPPSDLVLTMIVSHGPTPTVIAGHSSCARTIRMMHKYVILQQIYSTSVYMCVSFCVKGLCGKPLLAYWENTLPAVPLY